eukprot:TRINITY_DN112473_c0_g1_i1.p1 TRINITY_DN112473_c0_g1~~TRINITY_DN112473_c0_g1_i1.p1  ORF type:complete len:332 (-),score=59.57 TRINITY_DN112473_c0_g1_i1:152-1093(-)
MAPQHDAWQLSGPAWLLVGSCSTPADTCQVRAACMGLRVLNHQAFVVHLITVESVRLTLRRNSDASRAVERLLRVAKHSADAVALEALVTCLGFPFGRVRWFGLEALKELAHRGNPAAIDAVLGCLRDGSDEVKTCALGVLTRLADQGNLRAVDALVELLAQSSTKLYSEAADALALLAKRGDRRSIAALLPALETDADKLNFKAFNHLLAIAEPGNEQLTELLASRLQRAHSGKGSYEGALERMGIMLALGELAHPMEAEASAISVVVEAAVVCLGDSAAIVRSAGAQVLQQLARRGDSLALEMCSIHNTVI